MGSSHQEREQIYLFEYPKGITTISTTFQATDNKLTLFTLKNVVYLFSFQSPHTNQKYPTIESIGIFYLNQTFQFELVQELTNLSLKNHLSTNGKMVAIPFHT